MIDDINDYKPLCDVSGCKEPQTGEWVEVHIRTRFRTLELSPVRVHPCREHLREIRNMKV